VLERTLGVPLFQEQAMRVAMVAANFTPEEADKLRRAMATFKHTQGVGEYRERLIGGMVGRGYHPELAERVLSRSRASAPVAFPRATPPPLSTWPMPPPG
jgi:error-prone DNA polymerase